ncbi:MAG TPA: hypothetical protein VLE69_02320 [Candidatus Saccharimonadales bacterium]|nr:hypothetical protein [Candidatus Saccharimonadales bacterium]
MSASESPEFRTFSTAVNQQFVEFVDRAVRAGFVGPLNADRLLAYWPEGANDEEAQAVQSKLGEAIDMGEPEEPEIIASALRNINDFEIDQTVELRLSERSTRHWYTGTISDFRNGLLVIQRNRLVAEVVPPYYPALFRSDEARVLEDRRGTGHQSQARFVIKLSFFDTRIQEIEEVHLINKAGRDFGSAPETIPKQFKFED